MNKPASLALTTLLRCIAPGATRLHVAPAAAPGEAYYTEEKMYQSRPEPARDTPFGCIGASGLMTRIHPGVTVKVEQTMPGSPAAGKFSKGEIITGINGVALKGLNPFVALGNALTKAEATPHPHPTQRPSTRNQNSYQFLPLDPPPFPGPVSVPTRGVKKQIPSSRNLTMTTLRQTTRFAALIFAWVPHVALFAQEPAATKATNDAPSPAAITRPKAKLPDSPLVNMTLVGRAATDPNYFIWCTSPIQDTDGKVHLFCSRWPATEKKMKLWFTHSEVVRYVGDGPEGPFKLADVVLPANPRAPWNNSNHNPAITKAGDTFVLTYITFDHRPKTGYSSHRMGICMATAKSLQGPWTLVKGINPETQPGLVIEPSSDPNHWTFAARLGLDNQNLLVHKGKFYLYFKIMGDQSKTTANHSYGVAVADKLEGPYVLSDKPVTDNIAYIEDATSFFWNGKFHLLTTDNFGKNTGIFGAGILWRSDTYDNFKLADAQIGFLLPKDLWNPPIDMKKLGRPKGSVKTPSLKFERPGILMQNGRPAYFYAPPGDSPDGEDRTSSYVFKINLPKP